MPLGTSEKSNTDYDDNVDNLDAHKQEVQSPSQAHWDNTVGQNLSGMENRKKNIYNDENYSDNNSASDIGDQENQSRQPGSDWTNNTSKKRDKEKKGRKGFVKRFGATGAVLGLLTGGVLGIGGSTGVMGSLLISVKEQVMTVLDQQHYTSMSRSNRILVRRLADESTAGSCTLIKFACRYTKPTSYQLKQLEKSGIKALDKDGNVIEENKLIGGTRPTHYEIDGEKISAKDFKKTIRENPKVRSAFRRAHNPRWVNWVDDKAVKLFEKLGIGKRLSEKLRKSKRSKNDLAEVTDELSKAENKSGDKIKKEIADEAGKFAEKEAKKSTKKTHDAKLMMAQVVCAAARAPNVLVNIQRSYRIAQYAKIGYQFLTVADAIKKGKATPKLVENAATILTQTYKKSDGTIKKSAMDSSLMKYSLGLGVSGNKSSYIPGVGGTMAKYLQIVNSGAVKTGCDLVSSTAAEVAVAVFDGIKNGLGPIGWAWTAGEFAIEGILSIDSVQKKISEGIGDIVQTAVDKFGSLVDFNKIAEYFLGDKTKGAIGTDIGDISGIAWSNSMADQASYVGNSPLTLPQKAAYDEHIVKPERVAMAEEDRLNHSPFDISSPNTFLGSIAIRFLPYLGSVSNPLSFISAISSISSSSLFNFTSPAAYAKNVINSNKCSQDALLAAESDIAVGPACDVQYGIPNEYMGIEPDQVASELNSMGQIDEDGNIVDGSELKEWTETCNVASSINIKGCVVNERKYALFGLYQIDKRAIDDMDEDPDAFKNGSLTQEQQSEEENSSGASSAIGEPEFEQAQPLSEAESRGDPDNPTWPGKENGKIADSDLAELSFAPGQRMYKQAAEAMEEMNKAYKAEKGADFQVNSAYRSFEEQEKLFSSGQTAARGGRSNHGWGLAIDIQVGDFGSDIYNWLKANAHKYGFVHPPWAEPAPAQPDGKRHQPEQWHWEYARRVY